MKQYRQRRGFTLLEIIVTILVSVIALGAAIPLLGRVFQLSHEPRVQLRDLFGLQAAMEDLVALHADGSLADVEAAVGAEGGLYAGRFAVVHNRYVAFTGGSEGGTPSANNLLKVTLANPTGDRLTRLFAEEAQ